MRLKNVEVFLFMPSAYQKGKMGHNRNQVLNENHNVIKYIRGALKADGIKNVTVNCYDACVDNWSKQWERVVSDADLHLFYLPQGNSSWAGRGYYDNYKKYRQDKVQGLVYRRQLDHALNFYHCNDMIADDPHDWDRHARIDFGANVGAQFFISRLQTKYKGDEELELPENLAKYQDYKVRRIYNCTF